ncbi:RNA 2',3'-cyclic phosphodiesterase [Bacillus sp. M6-12]|uniref:RNA 2',3'-cyclic phosphodiesterase n=1 Tax=Bacillus sp. M6-12 TaxID=2054166 RepID=UPI000C782EDE|nr:RNA 2',3'-cyclic phosphodiesterase [Bacillus sp. M6-12]PLS14896.1 RNA 2',3'-cyclic phosphodiesterase [Bacillus sp. M6-12]
MNQAHFFFAATLPPEAKAYIHQLKESIEGKFPFKRWVHPEEYHITLAFLGNAPEQLREQAISFTDEALRGMKSFSLSLSHLGTFGKKDEPRIFWCGLEPNPELAAVQKEVYHSCIQAGFTLEKRPFKPHITLARKYAGSRFSPDELEQVSIGGTEYTIDTVTLYQTHSSLTPKYKAVHTIKLQ